MYGEIPFGQITIQVQLPILIPRPETEEWCYHLIDMLRATGITKFRILDLCTGSGCIALALAHAFPDAQVVGVDNNPAAVILAQHNAQRLSITNCTWLVSDLFEHCTDQQFDLIVANPPYIRPDEWPSLAPAVRLWEDYHALVASANGLHIITQIINRAPAYLNTSSFLIDLVPQLYIEIGYAQGSAVRSLMMTAQYATIHIWQDYAGHDRLVCGSHYNVEKARVTQ
jgi:release factor glutamine methyltransferase